MQKPPNVPSATYINTINKINALDVIWRKKQISRSEIAKATGLSAPTVTRILESLRNGERLVRDAGVKRTGNELGRPANLVEFLGAGHYAVGIVLGSTRIQGILTDLNAKILAEEKIVLQDDWDFDATMKRVAHMVDAVIADSGVERERVCGVGVSVIGWVHPEKCILLNSPRFPWVDADIAGGLERLVDLPVRIESLSRAAAYGEQMFGRGEEFKNFIAVNIQPGSIAAGIMIDGKIFHGKSGRGGAFSHMTLDRESKVRCGCGNFGCLEALASSQGIVRTVVDRLEEGAESTIRGLCANDFSGITLEMVAQAAGEGDRLAREALLRAADYIGIGVAALLNIFDPQAIFIGGYMLEMIQDGFYEKIEKTVKERAVSGFSKDVLILPGSLGTQAGVLGAVSLILREVLRLNIRVREAELTTA